MDPACFECYLTRSYSMKLSNNKNRRISSIRSRMPSKTQCPQWHNSSKSRCKATFAVDCSRFLSPAIRQATSNSSVLTTQLPLINYRQSKNFPPIKKSCSSSDLLTVQWKRKVAQMINPFAAIRMIWMIQTRPIRRCKLKLSIWKFETLWSLLYWNEKCWNIRRELKRKQSSSGSRLVSCIRWRAHLVSSPSFSKSSRR